MENSDNAKFLQILLERQGHINTLADKPDWLKEDDDEGQSTVFEGLMGGVAKLPLDGSAAIEDTDAVRNTAGDPNNTAGWNWRDNKRPSDKAHEKSPDSLSPSATASSLPDLSNATTLNLTNAFIAAQEERVQTYTEYERTFDMLLKNTRLNEYPMLVGEVTARFAAISSSVLAVLTALRGKSEDNAKSVGSIIAAIQDQEKDKLAVVAASHLDRVQVVLTGAGKGSSLQLGSMQHMVMPEFTKKRIQEIESKVVELLEEIAEIKCEILLG